MSEFLETFVKLVLPIILALIAVVSALKDLFSTKKKIYEEREKVSKFSYDLYKITENEDLRKLAIEYGYAAITKESFLTLEQRKALVGSINPTRDIDLFVKCRGLIDIKTEPLSFFWKKKRYKFNWYLYPVLFFRVVFYVIAIIVFTLPLTYHAFLPQSFIEKIAGTSSITKIGLIMYVLLAGGSFAYINLSAAVKLIDSLNLIKRHAESQD